MAKLKEFLDSKIVKKDVARRPISHGEKRFPTLSAEAHRVCLPQ